MMRPIAAAQNLATPNRPPEHRPPSTDMRILHLAAGNRWTGAAAPAFAEVEALRGVGIDAHYAYVGGYKLEAKIRQLDFAHAAIEKAQNPASFLRNVRALTALGPFDIVHAHLTYDHWVARFVAKRLGAALARTFHSRRVLRSDPFTRLLVSETPAICVVNQTFVSARQLRKRAPAFTPPPVDHRQFTPAGDNVRSAYGIAPHTPLLTVIGKLSKGRGFETALQAFAAVRRSIEGARMMIIGHGEHRGALESLASELGIAPHLVWAGYHETDLAEHYRAADALLFTGRGSDEGHRAVLEGMACGVPPVAVPIDGIAALVGGFGPEVMAVSEAPDAIARTAVRLLSHDRGSLSEALVAHSLQFGYQAAASRLIAVYAAIGH